MVTIKMLKKILGFKNKKVKSYFEFLKDKKLIDIGINTITPEINVNIRKQIGEKYFLKIGNDSVVNGNFVFENEQGVIKIGDRTFIGGGTFVSIDNICIGNDVLISWGCTFMDNNAHSLNWNYRKNDVEDWKKGLDENKIGHYKDWKHVKSAPIVVKDKAWIGFEVSVLKGVTIGEGAVVGSRSVITKDVPDWTVVAGNPAKVIREVPLNEREYDLG